MPPPDTLRSLLTILVLSMWVALGCLCGCVTPPSRPPIPARPAVVESLVFEGVTAIPPNELAGFLRTESSSRWPWRPRPVFDPIAVEEDVARVRALYRRLGYYNAEVAYALDWNESRGRVRIRFRVKEGEPVILQERQIDLGLLPEPESGADDSLLDDLPLREGNRFDLATYAATKQKLLERLADQSHPQAEIIGGAEVDVPTLRARVHWKVHPGPRVEFGPARVTGLDRVEEKLVRQEVTVREGEGFSRQQLTATQRGVYGLGLFRSVIVAARPPDSTPTASPQPAGGPAVWPVDVKVVERPPRSIEVGVGYGTEEQGRARVAWVHRNLFGGAQQLRVQARYSDLRGGVEAELKQPRFLSPSTTLTLRAGAEREDLESFEDDRVAFRTQLSRPLGALWSGRVGHTLEWSDITSVSPGTETILEDPEDTSLLSYLEVGLGRSSVDEPADPRRGGALDLSGQLSLSALGSDFNYATLSVEGKKFVGLWGSVLALRLRLATTKPFGGTQPDEIPLVARFFSGGSNSVRGFGYQELGPLDPADEPVGGTSLAEGNLELRFPIWRQLGGVLFVDAGEVHLDPFRWELDEVFYSVGGGVRYRTPLGPLRFDFGYVLNPEDEVDRSRIHFSVGQAF